MVILLPWDGLAEGLCINEMRVMTSMGACPKVKRMLATGGRALDVP